MSDPASQPPGLDRWHPECPGCRYDLAGLPDGRCPECGRGFMHAELRAAALKPETALLTEAQQTALLRITGWLAVLTVPLWLALEGARIAIISGIELWHGCHWTEADYNSVWTPQTTTFPTAREAFPAGLLWMVAGIALGVVFVILVRCIVAILIRLGIRPYADPPPDQPHSGPPRP